MKKIITTLALLLTTSCGSQPDWLTYNIEDPWEEEPTQIELPQKSEINWVPDLSPDEIDEKVLTSKKPVLLFFYNPFCPACKAMDSQSWENPEIIRLVNDRYLAIRVNTRKTPMSFLVKWKADRVPATFVVNTLEGTRDKLQGFQEPDTLEDFLEELP